MAWLVRAEGVLTVGGPLRLGPGWVEDAAAVVAGASAAAARAIAGKCEVIESARVSTGCLVRSGSSAALWQGLCPIAVISAAAHAWTDSLCVFVAVALRRW